MPEIKAVVKKDTPTLVTSSKNTTPKATTDRKKRGEDHKKRMKIRTFAIQQYENNGKWPTYKLLQEKYSAGPTLVSSVMKDLKRSNNKCQKQVI